MGSQHFLSIYINLLRICGKESLKEPILTRMSQREILCCRILTVKRSLLKMPPIDKKHPNELHISQRHYVIFIYIIK